MGEQYICKMCGNQTFKVYTKMYSNNIKPPKTATEIVCEKCNRGMNIVSEEKDTLISLNLGL